MALSSFQLFLNQIQPAPDMLKLKVLQAVFDLLIVYDQEFLGRSEEIVSPEYRHSPAPRPKSTMANHFNLIGG